MALVHFPELSFCSEDRERQETPKQKHSLLQRVLKQSLISAKEKLNDSGPLPRAIQSFYTDALRTGLKT